MKKCSKCGEVKGDDGFYLDRTRGSGLTAQCKLCMNIGAEQWRLNNRGRVNKNARDWQLLRAGAPFVVYCHSDSLNNVVYIGHGYPGRPWQRSGRNAAWQRHFLLCDRAVHIIGRYNTKREAALIESALLWHLEKEGRYPLLNIE